jgi:hypothetical protein
MKTLTTLTAVAALIAGVYARHAHDGGTSSRAGR